MYWGRIEERQGREKYEQIREYIFAALVARTDIDFIALDKGELSIKKAVDKLIDKMEQYANYGFDYMAEKLEDNPNYFFKDTSFLRIFLDFLNDEGEKEEEIGDEPESLD